MIILGVYGATDWYTNPENFSSWCHGSSASLIIDGQYMGSIEEERLSRIKYDGNYPQRSVDSLLKAHGLKNSDVDIVAFCGNPNDIFLNRKISSELKKMKCDYRGKNFHPIFSDFLKYSEFQSSENFESFFKKKFENARIEYVSHHLAHSFYSLLTSPFEESNVLSLDGGGDSVYMIGGRVETIHGLFGIKNKTEYTHVKTFKLNDLSSSSFYASASFELMKSIVNDPTKNLSLALGLESSPGKIMGLSAYGKNLDHLDLEEHIHILKPFEECIPEVYFDVLKVSNLIFRKDTSFPDIAATIQKFFENSIISFFENLPKELKRENLCLSGGSALNIILNTKLIELGIFKDVHVPPAPNDSGLSCGASLYVANKFYKDIKMPKNIGCVGLSYDDLYVEKILIENSNKISFKLLFPEELFEVAASHLKENKIVAWHQGKSEYGPRALGNRSIFANPSFDNKNLLNEKVKFREWWRPYAGMVMLEHLHDWFILPKKDSHYMLFNSIVKEDKRGMLKSITHADNSCRIQTVTEDINEKAYYLLKKFYEKTGIPVLLNTSFNTIPGEPIVETPADAINSFLHSNIDVLFINEYMITKNEIHLN